MNRKRLAAELRLDPLGIVYSTPPDPLWLNLRGRVGTKQGKGKERRECGLISEGTEEGGEGQKGGRSIR